VAAYWSVARTRPFCEDMAKRFLTGQGFVCYLPKCKIQVGPSKKHKRTVTMFATYLFVQIVDEWHRIQYTMGIRRVLTDHMSKPVVVRDNIINALRAREDRRGIIELPTNEFSRGQRVRILTGQFAGRLALYDGMTNRQRERVLLGLLGQRVPVELHIGSCLEAV
jgi:transcription antitermination factor NusG